MREEVGLPTMVNLEQINPRMLSWARETAGFSVPEAAEKLGLKDTAKATATEKLQALESGDGRLPRTVLQKAAIAFRRPMITFYLSRPPRRGERGDDFRTAPGSVSARENGMLDALVRDVRARQQIVREVLVDEEEALLRPFVGSASVRDGAQAVSAGLRSVLGLTKAAQRRARYPAQLFSVLRGAAERAGVYVLLLGDLGSYHSDLSE